MLLDVGGWYPKNRAALLAHIERWRERVGRGERLVATFDFDNTTIFHDVGEATMRYQLERLELRMTLDELAALLPEEVRGVRELSSGIALSDVRSDLLESYARLGPLLQRGGERPSFDDRSTDETAVAHRDFAARMAWLYSALEDEPALGAGVAYPFLTRWVGGFVEEDVRQLAAAAVAMAEQEPPGRLFWRSGEKLSLQNKKSGAVTARFSTGLRAHAEMNALMRALEDAGVLVYIISASQQQLVEGAVAALGYPVPRERVFGMRLERDGERLLASSLDTKDYPLTWRGGKREIIERFLPAPPVLAAGDSDTDLEMLTSFAETELRLVINRDLPGDIRSLYDDERTLLQGRDETLGCFRPARESVLLAADSGPSLDRASATRKSAP